MSLPAHPHAAGGGYQPSPLPLMTVYAVSSSLTVQAFSGQPAQSDANLYQNINSAVTSSYIYTATVTGARGGAFRFPVFQDTLQDHIHGYRTLHMRVRAQSTGGDIDGHIEVWGDGNDDESSDPYLKQWTANLLAGTWSATTYDFTLEETQRLNGWPSTYNIDQLFAMWKPVTGATRSARYGWARIYEQYT